MPNAITNRNLLSTISQWGKKDKKGTISTDLSADELYHHRGNNIAPSVKKVKMVKQFVISRAGSSIIATKRSYDDVMEKRIMEYKSLQEGIEHEMFMKSSLISSISLLSHSNKLSQNKKGMQQLLETARLEPDFISHAFISNHYNLKEALMPYFCNIASVEKNNVCNEYDMDKNIDHWPSKDKLESRDGESSTINETFSSESDSYQNEREGTSSFDECDGDFYFSQQPEQQQHQQDSDCGYREEEEQQQEQQENDDYSDSEYDDDDEEIFLHGRHDGLFHDAALQIFVACLDKLVFEQKQREISSPMTVWISTRILKRNSKTDSIMSSPFIQEIVASLTFNLQEFISVDNVIRSMHCLRLLNDIDPMGVSPVIQHTLYPFIIHAQEFGQMGANNNNNNMRLEQEATMLLKAAAESFGYRN